MPTTDPIHRVKPGKVNVPSQAAASLMAAKLKAMSQVETSDAVNAIDKPLAAGRRFLWFGFGSMLLVMVVMGWDSARSLRAGTDRSAMLMKGFRERDRILDLLRDALSRSGGRLQDYLSELNSGKADIDRQALLSSHLETIRLLQLYKTHIQRGQQGQLEQINAGVEAYWQSIRPVLMWDAQTLKQRGDSYRIESIGPLRAEVTRLTRDITLLNEGQFDIGEREVAGENQFLRNRLILAAGLGVILGFIVAGLVITRIQGLEHQAEVQYKKVESTKNELLHLAGRLDAAQEDERRKLSRELHDEVGQSMSALLMDLGRLEELLPTDQRARSLMAATRDLAEQNVKSIRDMALLLRPSMLDDLGLIAALKWQGREVARRTGLNVSIEAEEDTDELPDAHRTCVYRVVQEALNNCVKHARAHAVMVSVRTSPAGLEVCIQDDGVGFDPGNGKGVGLIGMEERVSRMGGSLLVLSHPGDGTTLTVLLPILHDETVS